MLGALGSWLVVYRDFNVVCRRGGFDSSWVRVFVDVTITHDSEALLQDCFLVLCGVGTRCVPSIKAGCANAAQSSIV